MYVVLGVCTFSVPINRESLLSMNRIERIALSVHTNISSVHTKVLNV